MVWRLTVGLVAHTPRPPNSLVASSCRFSSSHHSFALRLVSSLCFPAELAPPPTTAATFNSSLPQQRICIHLHQQFAAAARLQQPNRSRWRSGGRPAFPFGRLVEGGVSRPRDIRWRPPLSRQRLQGICPGFVPCGTSIPWRVGIAQCLASLSHLRCPARPTSSAV